MVATYNPSIQKTVRGEPWGSNLASLICLNSVLLLQRDTFPQDRRENVTKDGIWCQYWASKYAHTCAFTHMQTCIHTFTFHTHMHTCTLHYTLYS